MITSTRTYTRYFDNEHLRLIFAHATQLAEDWDSRSQWIDTETRMAGDARIAVLFSAILLCDEAVAS